MSLPVRQTLLKCSLDTLDSDQLKDSDSVELGSTLFARFSRLKREIVTLDELEELEGHFFDENEPEWAHLTESDYDEEQIHNLFDETNTEQKQKPKKIRVPAKTLKKLVGKEAKISKKQNFEREMAPLVKEATKEVWCDSIQLLHLPKLDFHQAVVEVESDFGSDSISEVEFEFLTLNPIFSEILIWLRFGFLVLTFIVTVSINYKL